MFNEGKIPTEEQNSGEQKEPQSHEDLMREKFSKELDQSIAFQEDQISVFDVAVEEINNDEKLKVLLQDVQDLNARSVADEKGGNLAVMLEKAEKELRAKLKTEGGSQHDVFGALKANNFQTNIAERPENIKKYYEESRGETVEKSIGRIERNKKAAIEKGGSEVERAFSEYEAYRLSGKDLIRDYVTENLNLEKETDEFNDKFEELKKTHSYYIAFIEKQEWSDSGIARFPDYNNYKEGDYLEDEER